MKFLLSVYYLIWILNTIKAQDMFPALILVHNGINFDLVDQSAEKDFKSFKILILTCPAPDEELKKFEEYGSENGFIIEEIFQPIFDLEKHNYNRPICKKQYSPNILADEIDNKYMFGYIFYFNNEQLEILTDVVLKGSGSWDESETHLIKAGDNFFCYISIIVQLNADNSITSTHEASTNEFIGYFKNCEDFNSGISFVQDKNIDEFYEKDNQMPILNRFLKPNLDENELNEMYLVTLQLTPFNDFDSYSKKLCTCSYLNTAPMWNTIANGSWKRIEEFTKKLTEIAPIEITTGTLGILQLPKSEYPHEMKSVYLNKTPVPEAFWKFVKYHSSSKYESAIVRGIVIVTFNYVSNTVSHNPLCSENVCKTFGWEVGNEDYKTGFTYCCRVDEVIMKRLGQNDVDASLFTDFDLRDSDRGNDDSNQLFDTLGAEENS